jgi:hypothetical protein
MARMVKMVQMEKMEKEVNPVHRDHVLENKARKVHKAQSVPEDQLVLKVRKEILV